MPRIEVVQLSDLKTGDQTAVMGNVVDLHPSLLPLMDHTKGIYFHHGIFDREKLEVIDFHGVTKADAKPKRRPILEFVARGRQLFRVLHENCLPVAETMKMVNEATEQRSYWPGYDLITNNWETFATYLKTGKKYSAQASAALLNLLINAAAAVTGAAVVAGSPSVSSFEGQR